MEFQTLKKNKKNKWIVGNIIAITLIITITFIGTMAKYKSTSHTSIAKGVINYNYDLDIVAVNIQNDDGKYVSSIDIPSSGYTLNKDKSFCKIGNDKVNVYMEYKGKVYISTNKKGTKCELYFDKGAFKTKDLILSQNIIDNSRASGSFTSVFQENTAGRIFNSIDDDGETYFFAGSNPNNWVKFGANKEGQELYWRIIRINGDESIRLIYNGTTADQTGETTQIGTSVFNAIKDDNAYVGYMYGTPGSTTYAETHVNKNDSTIKSYIDNWYKENLEKNYKSYIDLNAGFCNDKGLSYDTMNGGIGETTTIYLPYFRITSSNSFTYKCNINDLFTPNESSKGNKILTSPIGLLTMDEAIFAGAHFENNTSYWLRTGQVYWTMSPALYNYETYKGAFGYDIAPNGYINGNIVLVSRGVRPVINLKSDTLKIGSGTTRDPYRIS